MCGGARRGLLGPCRRLGVVVVVRLWRNGAVRRLPRRLARRRERAAIVDARERVLAVVSILAALASVARAAFASAAVDVRLVAILDAVATRALGR